MAAVPIFSRVSISWYFKTSLVFVAALGFFPIVKTYRIIGAVTKRRGQWKRGTILIKPNLPITRKKSLAAHEVLHSAIALDIIPEIKEKSIISEEAIATAIEVLHDIQSGNEEVKKSPLVKAGAEAGKAIIEGKIPTEKIETIARSIAMKAAQQVSGEALSENTQFMLKRIEALNKGLADHYRFKNGEIQISEYSDMVVVASPIELFGHKIGWAKSHGLITPEIERHIEMIWVQFLLSPSYLPIFLVSIKQVRMLEAGQALQISAWGFFVIVVPVPLSCHERMK